MVILTYCLDIVHGDEYVNIQITLVVVYIVGLLYSLI